MTYKPNTEGYDCQMNEVCDKVSNLQVFSSMRVTEDGALLIGWSNAEWRAIGADFGFIGSSIVPADFSLSKIPARNFIR